VPHPSGVEVLRDVPDSDAVEPPALAFNSFHSVGGSKFERLWLAHKFRPYEN